MMTFDFETAWQELAKPCYDALPQNIRDLYARVIEECAGLGQMKNLNMPWPHQDGEITTTYLPDWSLRALFEGVPSETLAEAARVIYFYGHWWSGSIAGRNPDTIGGHWKFANYADQVLALKCHTFSDTDPCKGTSSLDPARDTRGNGLSYRVHQGVIRAQCSTPDSWQWDEVCYATRTQWERLRKIDSPILPGNRRPTREQWDRYVERFKQYVVTLRADLWPKEGRAADWLHVGERYMVDENEIKARHARQLAADPARVERARLAIVARYEDITRKAAIQRDGYLWMLENGVDAENAIYYDHTGKWCFGWRTPLTRAAVSELLDIVSEFPYEYQIKHVDGTHE